MKPQLLMAVTLAGLSVPAAWFFFGEGTPPGASCERQPRTNQDRQTSGQRVSRSTTGKPGRELSDDDLAAISGREGAAAALAAAKSQPWPDRDHAVYFILSHLAIENPEFVAAELKTSGLNPFLKSGLVDAILKNWKDGRKALDWAENQLTGELRCKAVAGALGILVKSEPDAAFGYFEKMPPSEARRQTIPDLFAAWGSRDPKTALMRAKEQAPEDAQSATEHVLRGWAKADPAAAAAWVVKTAPTNETLMAGVYQSWISLSPDQAKLWFDSLPEGDAKRNAFTLTHSAGSTITMPVFSTRRVMDDTWASKPIADREGPDLRNWAIQDTEGARSFVEQSGNNPVSKQLAAQVASAISGKNGPPAAIDWALGLAEENGIRDQALWFAFHEWSEKDPEAAGAKLVSMRPEQWAKLPLSLVNTWVQQDPAAAANWVAGWKGGNQASMIGQMIDKWPDQDPQAAYQWLGNLPAGAGRDAGIRTIIRRERDSAPDTLQPWIDQISDPQFREMTQWELDGYLKKVRDE